MWAPRLSNNKDYYYLFKSIHINIYLLFGHHLLMDSSRGNDFLDEWKLNLTVLKTGVPN